MQRGRHILEFAKHSAFFYLEIYVGLFDQSLFDVPGICSCWIFAFFETRLLHQNYA